MNKTCKWYVCCANQQIMPISEPTITTAVVYLDTYTLHTLHASTSTNCFVIENLSSSIRLAVNWQLVMPTVIIENEYGYTRGGSFITFFWIMTQCWKKEWKNSGKLIWGQLKSFFLLEVPIKIICKTTRSWRIFFYRNLCLESSAELFLENAKFN